MKPQAIVHHARNHARMVTCFAFFPTDFRAKERELAVKREMFTADVYYYITTSWVTRNVTYEDGGCALTMTAQYISLSLIHNSN